MSDLATIRPKGSGNASVPEDCPLSPQLFVDLMMTLFGGTAPSLANALKLSLPPVTPVATQVSVSDGFVLHDSVYGDVFYYTNGTAPSGGDAPAIEKYSPANRPDLDDITWRWNNANDATQGGAWGDGGGNYAGLGDDSVTHFWDTPVDTIDHTYTFTHPAVQSLAAASTAQGGVFVVGGTQDGVYARDSSKDDAAGGIDAVYHLLGGSYDVAGALSFYRSLNHGAFLRWGVSDSASVPVYYSLSDVATPDLATDWKNASDDSPASITVTSVSAGELAAGLRIGDVTYPLNGSTNRRGKYSDVLGVAPDVTWDGTQWTDGTTNGTGNTAFPWDAGLGVRDDVAAEANWHTI